MAAARVTDGVTAILREPEAVAEEETAEEAAAEIAEAAAERAAAERAAEAETEEEEEEVPAVEAATEPEPIDVEAVEFVVTKKGRKTRDADSSCWDRDGGVWDETGEDHEDENEFVGMKVPYSDTDLRYPTLAEAKAECEKREKGTVVKIPKLIITSSKPASKPASKAVSASKSAASPKAASSKPASSKSAASASTASASTASATVAKVPATAASSSTTKRPAEEGTLLQVCVPFPLVNSPLTSSLLSLCFPLFPTSQRLKAFQTKAAAFKQAEYTRKFEELFMAAKSANTFNNSESMRLSQVAEEHAQSEAARRFGDMAEHISILESEAVLLSSLRSDLESTLLTNDTHQLAVYLREATEKVELLDATKKAAERQLGKKPRTE